MKENKKAILEILKKKSSKKDGKFENLVLNLALQKIDSAKKKAPVKKEVKAEKKKVEAKAITLTPSKKEDKKVKAKA